VEYKHTNLPQISKRKLNLNNGQDNTTIWVADEGKVYDVTESSLWQNGKHYEHWAGQELQKKWNYFLTQRARYTTCSSSSTKMNRPFCKPEKSIVPPLNKPVNTFFRVSCILWGARQKAYLV